MKVYIDLVILLNFSTDLILLISVNYILRRNVKLYRLLLGSLFGTLTLFLLFIKMNNIILFLFKIIVSIIMILVSFGYKDIIYFTKNIIYFYLVSMLIGGAITFLNNQFSYTNKGLVFINNGLSISYALILAISLFIYFIYIKCFKRLRNNYSNYYNGSLYINDNKINVNAFLDTGNKLIDPISKKNIILINKELLKDISINNILFVPFNSLNNHGLLECIKGGRLVIDNKEYDNFLIGISNNNFFMDGIDCIINENIMEGLR